MRSQFQPVRVQCQQPFGGQLRKPGVDRVLRVCMLSLLAFAAGGVRAQEFANSLPPMSVFSRPLPVISRPLSTMPMVVNAPAKPAVAHTFWDNRNRMLFAPDVTGPDG